MKLISWNVNGLRACLGKGFLDFLAREDADIFAIQETKMRPEQLEQEIPGYLCYWNSAEKKGYSGTAVFARREPLSVNYDINDPAHVGEGRAITLEYPDFYFVTVYTPNAQSELARIDYRESWEDAFRSYVKSLDEKKPVIICGDMNVARSAIELKNPKTNEGNAGYSPQERAKMEQLLSSGFLDTFRELYPDKTGAYTWWSYRFKAREKNAGWRIDYFLISQRLRDRLEDSVIYSDIMGSDHCPVGLFLKGEI